ncbi:MAG: trigger factor [Lachnospiraceae bacterium]|nr:trigger factor [Lachnospiraceae bacterium]MEE1014391.1 trigger factor [Lachnospiraceae bacterium]
MSVKVETLEKNMAKLVIEVSAEEFEKALQAAYNKQKSKISIPGFRKGKVPRQMVEKMYGPGFFYEDAANLLIPTEYEKAAAECGVEIVSRPVIDIEQIEKGKAFIFTAEVAVKPEVTLGAYKDIEVAKADVEVSEEEVNAEVDKEREKNARQISVEDRTVENGDMIMLDFEGFVNGVAFDGGKGENYPLTIGSGSFIPGFEEQLVGAEIGKELDVNVTFPEEYQAPELAGKEATFKCKVNEIKVKELPEADDDFAQDVSKFDTLAEYKEDLKAKLAESKAAAAKRAKEDAVIEKIIENAEMEIPEAMIDTQARQLVDEFAQRIQAQGLSFEQYLQFTGMTLDTALEQMKPNAVKRIQSRLVLEAVVKAENIEVSEEDVKAEIAKMAESYKMDADKLAEIMSDDEKEQIKMDMAIEKAVELVTEAAKEV